MAPFNICSMQKIHIREQGVPCLAFTILLPPIVIIIREHCGKSTRSGFVDLAKCPQQLLSMGICHKSIPRSWMGPAIESTQDSCFLWDVFISSRTWHLQNNSIWKCCICIQFTLHHSVKVRIILLYNMEHHRFSNISSSISISSKWPVPSAPQYSQSPSASGREGLEGRERGLSCKWSGA